MEEELEELFRQYEEIQDKIRAIDKMALINYELDRLAEDN